MNQQFALHRFNLLLQLDLAENKKTYLITAGLILGLLLLLMLPMAIASEYSGVYLGLHVFAMALSLLAGSFFSSTLFNKYSSPNQGMAALMVPASKLEKFLVPFLVHLVYAVGICLIYWAFHFGFVYLGNSRLLSVGSGIPHHYLYRAAPYEIVRFFSYLYFFIVAATFTGSIYFSKNAYIKTAAICLAAVFAVFLVNMLVARFLTNHDLRPLPFGEWRFMDPNLGGRMFNVEFPEPVQGLIWAGLLVVLPGLWYLAYLRLKEKEI